MVEVAEFAAMIGAEIVVVAVVVVVAVAAVVVAVIAFVVIVVVVVTVAAELEIEEEVEAAPKKVETVEKKTEGWSYWRTSDTYRVMDLETKMAMSEVFD